MSQLYSHIRKQLTTLFDEHEASAIAFILLEDASGLSRTDVLMGRDDLLGEEEKVKLNNMVQRVLKHEPIQYVTGKTLFAELNIHVAPGVLIPRPETEELVDLACSRLKALSTPKVLDIGTGSGCIALGIKNHIPNAEVHACDISDKALQIAKDNAKRLNLDVQFHQIDILAPDIANNKLNNFDAIISNPPYICNEEKKEMDKNVLENEPHTALFVPDNDPLLFYKAITEKAIVLLKEKGILAFEINRRFGCEIKELMEQHGFTNTEIIKDQFCNNRIVIGNYEKKHNC
ncbi:MAG: peptide chain release factor N(5)-glutamine methyltransferase [Bacteroidaceae bacterium]|nr:peptide chain release factor N(5)-glutamine methyltransferase [Bacteroidaceae bacterium]